MELKKTCIKCGESDISTKYILSDGIELLGRTCKCGYSWAEETVEFWGKVLRDVKLEYKLRNEKFKR